MMDTDTLQSVLLTVATLAMGWYFGSQYTGRQAQPTYRGTMPEWLQTVKTVNAIMLVIFLACLIGVVVIERKQAE